MSVTISNEEDILNETALDIALYRAQMTQAQGDHLRAQGSISTLDTTATRLDDERTQAMAVCAEQISQLEIEIDIMVNDSIILQRILGMIDCPKSSFIQCNDANATFEKPELRTEMSKLQSDKVKNLINGAVKERFDDEDTKPISRAAFLQMFGQAKLRGGQAPADEGPGPDDAGCSLATNPNCGKLEDKFMEIAGEVDSDITVYKLHLEKRKGECKAQMENYESQIDDIRSRLDAWQTALAEATTRGIQAAEGERLKQLQYTELDVQHKETIEECETNLKNLESERCALDKIRGELYKMSAVPKFIQDCAVSPWAYGDCSKECMESTTDTAGVMNLTREITSAAQLGAGCPPLKLTQVCNKIRCPIDCIQSEWSEWSACSSQCGGGIRERIRSIKRTARFKGEPCGPASETETCNAQDCDKDCILSPWTKIQEAPCSKACGGGTKTSTRGVFQEAIGQGTCPEPLSHERFRQMECNLEACVPIGPTLVCLARVDVVILLDGSGSLGKKGWKATVAMGQLLVNAFAVPNIQAQVAVQLFSGPGTWYNWFLCTGRIRRRKPDPVKHCGISWVTPLSIKSAHFTTDMVDAAARIKALKFPSRSTFTGMALGQAESELTYGREGVPKVVLVVTDGIPTNPYKVNVASAKVKKSARLIWVPVGPGAPLEMIAKKNWASTPVEQNIVPVKDFKELEKPDIVSKIVAEVCDKAQ